jgi:plasmid stabilization system protein ParE
MIVVITDAAEVDLERIGDAIAQDNPRRAVSFVRELRQRCEQLADVPKAFPLVSRHEQTGVRRCVHGNYLIFYRVDLETVQVIHVLHGAMDYEPLLFPTGF